MYDAAASTSDSSFVKKLRSSGRSLVVFYGSQTGTAEEFAGRLAKEGARFGLKGMVADPEECAMEELAQLKELTNSLAIFCLATYGEGDPTDNAQEFFEWLQAGDADLNGLNYAVSFFFVIFLAKEFFLISSFLVWLLDEARGGNVLMKVFASCQKGIFHGANLRSNLQDLHKK